MFYQLYWVRAYTTLSSIWQSLQMGDLSESIGISTLILYVEGEGD